MENNGNSKPFIKWAGGKTRMLKYLDPYFKKINWDKSRYVEPFIGGGAVFFNYTFSSSSIINDFNEELINAYRVIQEKSSLEELLQLLDTKYEHRIGNKDFYLETRASEYPNKIIESTARFIFLNKTCFNGLYRVNSKGKFNVPMGKFSSRPTLYNSDIIWGCHKKLQNTDILCGDYKLLKEKIKKNDIVYLDPPYVPISPTSSFTQYTKLDFTFEDQRELKLFCDSIHEKGAKFILNNSDHPELRNLYNNPNYTIDDDINIARSVGASSKTRIKVKELIIHNM
tara:strand:+ start:2180 stop:3031 length:852 start_codon:yes stop_codon:yes gene_type:complete